ncbi:MAG: tetratricopeptide repeat protein [Thermoanaerobaculia bacterium]
MSEDELKIRFHEAIEKRDSGDAEGALKILNELVERYPTRASVWGTIGGIYFVNEDWANAARTFERATSLAPRSELSSVSLFNSLIHLGREAEASAEAARFRKAVPDSLEYHRLERELAERGLALFRLGPS